MNLKRQRGGAVVKRWKFLTCLVVACGLGVFSGPAASAATDNFWRSQAQSLHGKLYTSSAGIKGNATRVYAANLFRVYAKAGGTGTSPTSFRYQAEVNQEVFAVYSGTETLKSHCAWTYNNETGQYTALNCAVRVY